MTDEPAPKRVRQACRSCRRKKTRCSGEKPACSVCVRLFQPCEYPGETDSSRIQAQNAHQTESYAQSDLAARVAFLESRLGVRGSTQALSPSNSLDVSHHEHSRQSSDVRGRLNHDDIPARDGSRTREFTVVPSTAVLDSLTDTYFKDCHNQPYCYFVEAAFRQRLREGSLPDYLLLAFVATAARYSKLPFLEDCKERAIGSYARTAWDLILRQAFSSDQGLDLHAVQAANLLAIIDFTAGQHRLGWIKIGLAVRFAQGLRLNTEPDDTLPLWQQEERRRVFWSVYMLDRFVSCSRVRVPAILDRDCSARLPSDDDQIHLENPAQSPAVSVIRELYGVEKCDDLSDFALLVLMSSILGRVVRYSLQHDSSNPIPPWDFRSNFTRIRSILFSFEAFANESASIAGSIQDKFRKPDGYDRQKVGHYVWWRCLYHLCGCLLYHPFLLHNYLKQYRRTFPPSFARECLQRCQDHAEHLKDILIVIRDEDCCARGSFLGYIATVASSIHQLYQHSRDPTLKARSLLSADICLQFLEQSASLWKSYGRMATALREFDVGETVARILIEPSTTESDLQPEDMDALRRILDYGWLSDANRTEIPFRSDLPQGDRIQNWRLFEDTMGFDYNIPAGHGSDEGQTGYTQRHQVNFDSDWWFQLDDGDLPQARMFNFSP